jgi:cytoskeletal protein RodZ
MKTISILIIAAVGQLAITNSLLLAGQTTAPQSIDLNPPSTSSSAATTTTLKNNGANQTPKLSWGLDDIVKLSKAGVDESVILSYIQHSGVGYNPTAQDVIQLRELGVSAQITTVLMQRGGEVRQASTVEAQKQAQATAAAAPAQPEPVYAAPSTDAAPVSTVTYIGYSSRPNYAYSYGGYCAPTYYAYPYYPRYYGFYGYPRVSFGVSFGGGYHGGHHGSYGHHR